LNAWGFGLMQEDVIQRDLPMRDASGDAASSGGGRGTRNTPQP
jgi:hypothetical protein